VRGVARHPAEEGTAAVNRLVRYNRDYAVRVTTPRDDCGSMEIRVDSDPIHGSGGTATYMSVASARRLIHALAQAVNAKIADDEKRRSKR
jgi:hypothetical protein